MTDDGLIPLLTPWGETLDPDAPLPEYPRPQFERDSYLNLNGRWQYAITDSGDPVGQYDGEVVVPFSPESLLSGVQRQVGPADVLHYWRSFQVPDGFRARPDDRVLLHFGAVDQTCRVIVNGTEVGEHVGGYLPFAFDITDTVRPGGNELQVVVRDPSDTGDLSRGKQRLKRGGIWYTPQSGIWQTVWLEAVPAVAIGSLTVTPLLAEELVEVTVVSTAGAGAPPCRVEVLADGVQVAVTTGPAGVPLRLPIPQPRLWTPEDPFRYDLVLQHGNDRVRSYFGMRSFGVAPDAAGIPRLTVNGVPYFHAGVLDQGYWSDGLYTAPSDEALVHDIATMKDLGFTMLRKHIKVEPLRWYYHCDRLGMLVWQDMVNGGGRYNPVVISAPAVTPLRLKDSNHRAFARTDASAREQWLTEMRDTVDLLRNVVSLAVWVPFNEGWGQFDSVAVTDELRGLDPSRPIDHASGWHDQGAGDLTSLHIYFRPFRVPRRRARTAHRALVLSEYGGYSQRLDGHSVSSREFGYRRYSDAGDLARAWRRLHTAQIIPAVGKGLSATVYTQLSDVEDETNGLLTYDRRVLKIPAEVIREVNAFLRLRSA